MSRLLLSSPNTLLVGRSKSLDSRKLPSWAQAVIYDAQKVQGQAWASFVEVGHFHTLPASLWLTLAHVATLGILLLWPELSKPGKAEHK